MTLNKVSWSYCVKENTRNLQDLPEILEKTSKNTNVLSILICNKREDLWYERKFYWFVGSWSTNPFEDTFGRYRMTV